MAQPQHSHIFCVPFSGAGHAVNTLNVANALGSSTLTVHMLVLSIAQSQTWIKATGQPLNPNVHFVALASGKWETWTPAELRELVTITLTPEFNTAVDECIRTVQSTHPHDKCTGMIINGLMSGIVPIARSHNMKILLLNPVPHYMGRISGLQDEHSTMHTPYVLKGIADSPEDIHGELGDFSDGLGPMYHKMFLPTVLASDGTVYSNTNTGLEGQNYKQPQMADNHGVMKLPSYLVGPILPPLYARALDDAAARDAQLALADPQDSAIKFLNAQPARSVVYVALGSMVEIVIPQAVLLLKLLRRYKARFVFLYRGQLAGLLEALGVQTPVFEDGVITTWAPQLQVLIHPATKLVVSHGGFGTLIEGIYAGQPFLMSPISSDNFINARVMKHLGVAVGAVGENHYLSAMTRKDFCPIWGSDEDAEKRWDALFAKVLGENGGETLEKARLATLALRERIIEASKTDSMAEMQRLRTDITTPPL